jgi:adenylate kinase
MNRASKTKPLVLILMGPPGAGKGTHAGPLSEKLGLPHISTGDLFRENIRNQTPLGQKAKNFIDQGKLVPDELVLNMLFDRIQRPDCAHGYILDGFPRTVAQAEALDQRLKSSQVLALNFEIADEHLVERIVGRIACKTCGRPFHLKFDPPKEQGVCDACSGPLYQRDDDKAEIVIKRLEVYHNQTQPLIEYYNRKPDALHHIDSLQSKDQVFQDLLETVPSL